MNPKPLTLNSKFQNPKPLNGKPLNRKTLNDHPRRIMAEIGHGIRDYRVRCAALSRRLQRPDARGLGFRGYTGTTETTWKLLGYNREYIGVRV